MGKYSSSLPDQQALALGLNAVFGRNGSSNGSVTVLDREPNAYASGAPSEIVRCRMADGREEVLLCKYEHPDKEMWSDVPYEAKVYSRVVSNCGLSAPHFHGCHVDVSGRTWIILQYLDQTECLDESVEDDVICQAARWLGQFHAAQQRRMGTTDVQFLRVYDADHYLEWMRRARDYGSNGHGEFAWLSTLCERFEQYMRPVFELRPMITHGDYYLHNLLWDDSSIYPIDWEHAGIDLGEMDLVCLTHGWIGETVRLCEAEYAKARWPDGAPADFEQTLGVARLCLYAYHLGSQPSWASDPNGLWYGEELRTLGGQLGLI